MKLSPVAPALCTILLTVDALPFGLERRCMFPSCNLGYTKSIVPKEDKCDSVEKYSVDWFMDNAGKAKIPKAGACLFYTRGLSKTARHYAKLKAKLQMTTIWDVWPGGYYNNGKAIKANPLRCIMQKKSTDQREYFENMSTAFASMCDVHATVMDANITPMSMTFDTVTKTGIWFQSEFPTLRRGHLKNKVYMIEAISTNGATIFDHWKRKDVKATSGDDNEEEITKSIVTMLGYQKRKFEDTALYKQFLDRSRYGDRSGSTDLDPLWWEEDGGLSEEDLNN